MKKSMEGYFTVEAALLFPMILGVILFVIYSWFYQYDRCLMEMDTGTMALRGCADEIYDEKYVAWEPGQAQLTRKQDTVRAERTGRLTFPFSGFKLWNGEAVWRAKAAYENHRVSPVLFVRTYYKVTGG